VAIPREALQTARPASPSPDSVQPLMPVSLEGRRPVL